MSDRALETMLMKLQRRVAEAGADLAWSELEFDIDGQVLLVHAPIGNGRWLTQEYMLPEPVDQIQFDAKEYVTSRLLANLPSVATH
jgi:hypothetical protein